jgi:hypothetical protein
MSGHSLEQATFDEIWSQLRSWISTSFVDGEHGEVRDDGHPDSIAVLGRLPSGRRQQVFVSRIRVTESDEWVELVAPVCREHELPHREALIRNRAVLGHLCLVPEQGMYIYRHMLPLKFIRPPSDQFAAALALMMKLADAIEEGKTGTDQW